MEALKILEKKEKLDWQYDEEADVLYIAIGKPQPALGVDVGDGMIVRYTNDTKDVVGLTIIGFKDRLMNAMENTNEETAKDNLII